MNYKWEHDASGWYVVEHDGKLRTGPFSTQAQGVEWFREELDVKIEEEQVA